MNRTWQRITFFFKPQYGLSKVLFWVMAIVVSMVPYVANTYKFALQSHISFFDINNWQVLAECLLRSDGLIWTLFVMCLLCIIQYTVLGVGRNGANEDSSSVILLTFIFSFVFSLVYAGISISEANVPLLAIVLVLMALLALSFFTQMLVFERE